MKKKIIALSIIIILFCLVFNVSANNDDTKNENNALPADNPIIYEFEWGIIRGKYENKYYTDNGELVLKNYRYNRTLIIWGLGWAYEYGEIPNRTFGTVEAWKVIATKFIGFCRNGLVFGFGYKKIDFEWT